jgi:hypothetical protein
VADLWRIRAACYSTHSATIRVYMLYMCISCNSSHLGYIYERSPPPIKGVRCLPNLLHGITSPRFP